MKAFLASCLASASVAFQTFDPLSTDDHWAVMDILENGEPKSLYVAMGTDLSSGTTLNIPYNNRGYWSHSPTLDPEQFYKPNLLGGTLEYDMDMSQSNCGCISTIYLVSMPGKTRSGDFEKSDDGMYYCDANQVGGNYCPEFDIMEGNQWAYATTTHTCDAPNSVGFFEQCDRGGKCQKNFKNEQGKYGAGEQYTINTLKQFHVKLNFDKYGDDFGSFSTTLTQDDRSHTLNGDCPNDNKGMTQYLREGMAFAFSSWSAMDADWLWGDSCQPAECQLKNLFMSNFKITTGSDKPGPTPPTPVDDCTDCQYGDACATKSADECDGSCDCLWSWPGSESWDGPDAHCRCKKDDPPVPPTPTGCDNCQYGGDCDNKTDGDCDGSCDCHWSWPGSESWDGPDAKCRCK